MASPTAYDAGGAYTPTLSSRTGRLFSWCVVATLFAFLLNVYLTFWRAWPGAASAFGADRSALAWLQVLLYIGAVVGPALFVVVSTGRSLRDDAALMTHIANYIVKAAFWMVLVVGVADAAISFLRVEGLLTAVVSEGLAVDLGRNQFRGPYVHGPLIILALVLAAVNRTLGFHWLALLVVLAELQIVISRFVFSYEQAFMADLVRMWYGGLFLFASAHTLLEDAHVRVDVLYTTFSQRTKGLVNAVGAVVLGLPFCWTILILGMGKSSSIITSPLLSLEVTQAGFGMYVKYLLAAFLGVFAASMTVQFASAFLEGLADYREEPGKREASSDTAQASGH